MRFGNARSGSQEPKRISAWFSRAMRGSAATHAPEKTRPVADLLKLPGCSDGALGRELRVETRSQHLNEQGDLHHIRIGWIKEKSPDGAIGSPRNSSILVIYPSLLLTLCFTRFTISKTRESRPGFACPVHLGRDG